MKVLVVGGGSIGSRHRRNLRTLGLDALGLVEADAERRSSVSRAVGAVGFSGLAEGLGWGPDVAVIATPSYLHVAQALEAARAGCHLFVEKPLSHSAEGLAALAAEVERRGLVSLVGFNMRFHPGPAKVKELIDAGAIGRVMFARLHMGSYLPGWRPASDYRVVYSASAAEGGGCILDCIHEIDLAGWYLGRVSEVFCMADHLSPLEVDTEDVAMLTCRHESGALSQVHLDFAERTYERGCHVAGEEGSLFWDFRAGEVRLYEAPADRWTSFSQPEGWQINQTYLDQFAHYLECVRDGRPTTLPVAAAVDVTCAALAAKASARSGSTVSTRSVLA